MLISTDIPVFLKIDEIENHLQSLPSIELKLDYLNKLYKEFVMVCYNLPDNQIDIYLNIRNLSKKYHPILYLSSIDKYQTHISRSKYINFLRLIDEKLLPFVRKEIKKIDGSFKEDHSQIIKDYPIFDFNKEKIFTFIDSLTIDKLSYIEFIFGKRTDYYLETYSSQKDVIEIKELMKNDILINELIIMQTTFERYPERINEKNIVNIKIEKDEPDLFKNDKSLCGFNLIRIKEHAKKFNNTNESILYLYHVRKEAKQNSDLIPDKSIKHSFFTNLDYELDYYNKKQKFENEAILQKTTVEPAQNESKSEPIRLHWQSDDVLIPYLMDQLFNEGFINISDSELIRAFIEQSFYKRSGKIFTAKEVSTVKSNIKSNTKSNYKPKKAFKVDRVIDDIKSKRVELSKKKTSRSNKK